MCLRGIAVANRDSKNVAKFTKRNKWQEGEYEGRDKKRYKNKKRKDNGKRQFLDEDNSNDSQN